MTLKQVFIRNLKDFRKKEGLSQMQFAEFCDTSPSYIGHIETGRKFPSMDMIEKMAHVLRVEPYHLFKTPKDYALNADTENVFPRLPNAMKNQIKTQIDVSMSKVLTEILGKY
ncbi:MAG: helix-turn-helix transcriptional regulator [Treponema sp.]|jgi:transcriptional regulator with XRE-family HTH domain|nr:helix-turn-helix transcriptional regulator [Treponema sp.]